ncbi:MAG TPA: arsenate reductase [Thioalkalivibrio sp.]|nr:arsenate reductase [Thioalkalivibrio sp.]
MSRLTLYGIPNCDTVRRARRELDAAGLAHEFHDLRKQGLEPATLDRWMAAVGWERLLNRRGTTWRHLPEDLRDGLDAPRARDLMLAEPTLIRRPVIDWDGAIHVGWDGGVEALLG